MPMQPYVEADKIDKQITKLWEKYPIKENNLREWLTFLRTVRSTITLLTTEVRKHIPEKGTGE